MVKRAASFHPRSEHARFYPTEKNLGGYGTKQIASTNVLGRKLRSITHKGTRDISLGAGIYNWTL
jgi:hypothetical protein